METPHPLPLNTYSGTLAVDLGCCPFDYPTYLVQSDSYGSPSWHSRFDNLWQTLTSPRVFSALPPYGCHRASPKAISGRTSYLRVRLEFLPYPHLMPTLFNGCGSGPPRSFTTASSWTWVGHPVSGLACADLTPYSDLVSLRLRSSCCLTLPAHAARRTVLQKVRGRPCGLPQLVNTGFQVLFHSPPGVLFTFPSRYSSLSVTE